VETLPTPAFPEVIDSTLVGSWKSCRRKCFYEHFLKLAPKGENVHLTAGKAYAVGHETFKLLYYGEGASFERALRHGALNLIRAYGDFTPPDNPASAAAKTWDQVLLAYFGYYDNWDPRRDKIRPAMLPNHEGVITPSVEFNFAVPLDILHPVTGNPLLYAGALDGLCEATFSEKLFVYDDKTTYQMGPTWANQWLLRSQFTGYTWAARQTGYDVDGVIIRGAAIQATQVKFIESICYRSQWQIDEWLETLYFNINEMLLHWEFFNSGQSSFHKDLDSACTSYGGCSFSTTCLNADPAPTLLRDFAIRHWSPIDVESL